MNLKKCPIDNQAMNFKFKAVVMQRHHISYFQCPQCDLIQTEKPYWLEESYHTSYTITDTGIAVRNWNNRLKSEAILQLLFEIKDQYLDIGGGCGLFARLMRDIGIDCYTTDKYASNIFARGFEPKAEFQARALFAFEVLEHLEHPLEFLKDIFKKYNCQTLIFTTESFNDKAPDLSWQYYAFNHGQHITFYSLRSLKALAEKLNCHFIPMFSFLYLFVPRSMKIPYLKRYLLTHRIPFFIYAFFLRMKRRNCSFTETDSFSLSGLTP